MVLFAKLEQGSQGMKERIASQVTSFHNVVMLAALLGVGLTGSIGNTPAPASDTLAQRVRSGAVAEAAGPVAPKLAFTGSSRKSGLGFNVAQLEQLRSQLRWKSVRFDGDVLETPDAPSRLLLVQAAAEH